MFVFRKIWCASFSWNTRVEIRPFAILPTKCFFFFFFTRNQAAYKGEERISYLSELKRLHLQLNCCFAWHHYQKSLFLSLRKPNRFYASLRAWASENEVLFRDSHAIYSEKIMRERKIGTTSWNLNQTRI